VNVFNVRLIKILFHRILISSSHLLFLFPWDMKREVCSETGIRFLGWMNWNGRSVGVDMEMKGNGMDGWACIEILCAGLYRRGDSLT